MDSPSLNSPLSPLNGATPTGRRHRRIQNLQAALDAERFDKQFLQEELKRLTAKLQLIDKQNTDHKNEISSLRLELASVIPRNGDLESPAEVNHRRETEERLRREVEGVEGELLTAIGDVSELREENANLNKKIEEMDTLISNWQTQAIELERFKESLQTQVNSLTRENVSLKESLAEAFSSLESYRLDNKMNISIECDDDSSTPRKVFSPAYARTPVENLSKVIDIQLKEQIDQNKSLNSQLSETQSEIASLRNKMNICESIIKSLKQDLADKCQEYQELSEENKKNIDIAAETESLLKRKVAEVEALTTLSDKLNIEIVQFQKVVSDYEQEVLIQKGSIHNYSERILQLEIDNNNLVKECKDYEKLCQTHVESLNAKALLEVELKEQLNCCSLDLDNCKTDLALKIKVCEDLTAQNQTINHTLIECQTNLEAKASQVLALENLQCDLEAKIHSLNGLVERSIEEMKNHVSSIKSLTDCNNNLKDKCVAQEAILDDNAEVIKLYKDNIEKLEKTCNDRKQNINGLTSKCKDYEAQCHTYQSIIHDLEQEIAESKENIRLWTQKFETAEVNIVELNIKLQGIIKKGEAESAAYIENINKLKCENKSFKEECDCLTMRCIDYENQCKILEEAIETRKNEIHSQKVFSEHQTERINTLEDMRNVLEEQCRKYKAQCLENEQNISQLQKDIEKSDSQIKLFTANLKDAENENELLKEKCFNYEYSLTECRGALGQCKDELYEFEHKYKCLDKQCLKYKNTINKFEDDVNVCSGEIEALIIKLKSADEECDSLKGMCNSYRREVDAKQALLNKLEADIKSYRETVRLSSNSIEIIEGELNDYKLKNEDLSNRCESLEQINKNLDAKCKTYESACNNHQQTMIAYENKLTNLKENILELSSKNKSLEDANKSFEITCRDFEVQIQTLRSKITESDLAQSDLQHNLRLNQNELESCKENLTNKLQEIHHLDMQLIHLNNTLSEKTDEYLYTCDMLENDNKDLQRSLQELSLKYEDAASNNCSLKTKCYNYEKQLESHNQNTERLLNDIKISNIQKQELLQKFNELEKEKNCLEAASLKATETYKTSLAEYHDNIHDLSEQCRVMKDEREQLQNELQQKVTEYERNVESHNENIKSLSEENNVLKAKCSELDAQCEVYCDTIKQYEVDIKMYNENIAELNNRCQAMEEERHVSRENHEKYKVQSDKILDECQAEIKTCNENIELLTEKCKALELEVNQCRSKCNEYETNAKITTELYQKEVASRDKNIHELGDELKLASVENSNLQEKCDKLEKLNERLQLDITKNVEKYQLCNEKFNNVKEELLGAQNNIGSLSTKLYEIENEKKEIEMKFNKTIVIYEEEVKSFGEYKESSTVQYKKLENEKQILNDQLQETIEKYKDDIRLLHGRIEGLTMNCQILEKEKELLNAELLTTIDKYQVDIKCCNEQIQMFKEKEIELTKSNNDNEGRVLKYEENIQMYKDKIRSYVKDIQDLSEQLKSVSSMNEELKISCTNMEKAANDVNEEMNRKCDKLLSYQERLSITNSQVNVLEEKINEKDKELLQKEASILQLVSNYEDSRQKCQSITVEIDKLKLQLEDRERAEMEANNAISSTTKSPTRLSPQFEGFINKYHNNEDRIKHSLNLYEDQCKKINELKTFLYKTNSNLTNLLCDEVALSKVIEHKKNAEEELMQLENANSSLTKKIFSLFSLLCVEVSYNINYIINPNDNQSHGDDSLQRDEFADSFVQIIDDIENAMKITKIDYNKFQTSLESVDKNSTTVYQEIQELVEKCKNLKSDVEMQVERNNILSEGIKTLQGSYDEVIKEKNETTEKLCTLQRVLKELKLKTNEDVMEQKKLAHENISLKRQVEILKCDMDNISLKLNLELDKMKNAYEKLSVEYDKVQNKLANNNNEQVIIDMKNEYEEKLGRMKQKMKQLYHDEMTRLTEKHKDETDAVCKKYLNRIKQYEEHVNQLMSEQWKIGEKLLIEKKENEELRRRLKEFRGSQQSLNSITSTVSMPHTKNEIIKNSRPNAISVSEVSRKKFPPPIPENSKFKQSHMGKVESGGLHMSDEEGELFDNTYLSDLKSGVCDVRHVGSMSMMPSTNSDKGRLSELQWRNSMCPPHLKSSYPAETQFHKKIKEEEIKTGAAFVVDDSPPVEKHIRNRKEPGQTAYHKPGPPTPSKNTGRLSLQGNETREALKEWNDSNPQKRSTPHKIMNFFMGNTSKADENTFGTPKGRRLSSIFRKPR